MTQSTMAVDFSMAEYRRHLQDLSGKLGPLENHPEQLHQIQPGPAEDRPKLKEILDRREFNRVHGPTAAEIFWQRVLRWIDRLLNPAGKNGVSPIKVAIYVIVGVAVIMLVIWTKRRFDFSRQPAPPREIVPFAPSARGWRAWLADARQYAQQQDWRNSVHFAYWAAVSFLEEHGAWVPDRARTPREYLGFLTPMNSAYPTLEALTRRFEVIWYGHQDAHEKDFQDALGQLEKLGCK